MGPEVFAAIAGPLAGAIIGAMGFMSKRNMISTDNRLTAITGHITEVSKQVQELHIALPTNYVTKEEIAEHLKSESYFHNKMLDQIRELRDEVIVLRAISERGNYK